MSFPLVLKSVTLNDLEQRNGHWIRRPCDQRCKVAWCYRPKINFPVSHRVIRFCCSAHSIASSIDCAINWTSDSLQISIDKQKACHVAVVTSAYE